MKNRQRAGVAALAAAWCLCAAQPGRAQAGPDQAQIDQMIEALPHQAHTGWSWGGLVFNGRYTFEVLVLNKCPTPEPVLFLPDSSLAPFVTIDRMRVIPANSLTPVPAVVRTPKEPPDDWGGPGFDPVTGRWVFPRLLIGGELLVQHAAPDYPYCFGPPKVHDASGAVFEPGPPTGGGSCLMFWLRGQRPAPPLDCTNEFRGLALQYIESLGEDATSAWAWLPTPDEINRMSDVELLSMKARAESQRIG